MARDSQSAASTAVNISGNGDHSLLDTDDRDQVAQLEHRVVPWMFMSEFEAVYEAVFSDEYNRRERGWMWLKAWTARSGPRTPTGVLTTMYFLGAQLQDNKVESEVLKSSYSMALISMVNHITQLGQHMPYPLPLKEVASHWGIPESLVSLRHQATHGDLPSLDMLRDAGQTALNWLKENYWKKELANTFDYEPQQDEDRSLLLSESSYISKILNYFAEIQGYIINSNKNVKNALPPLSDQLISHIKMLENRYDCPLPRHCELSEPKHARKARKLIMKEFEECWKKYNLSQRGDGLASCLVNRTRFIDGERKDRLPDDVVQVWSPIVMQMHKWKMILSLLRQLIDVTQQCFETKTRQMNAALWLKELCKAFRRYRLALQHYDANSGRPLDWVKAQEVVSGAYPHLTGFRFPYRPFKENKEVPQLFDILKLAFYTPVEQLFTYMSELLEVMTEYMPEETSTAMKRLVNIYFGNFPPEIKGREKKRKNAEERPPKLFTVQDAFNHIEKENCEENLGKWQHCTDRSWITSNCPIGLLPWQTTKDTVPSLALFDVEWK